MWILRLEDKTVAVSACLTLRDKGNFHRVEFSHISYKQDIDWKMQYRQEYIEPMEN